MNSDNVGKEPTVLAMLYWHLGSGVVVWPQHLQPNDSSWAHNAGPLAVGSRPSHLLPVLKTLTYFDS